MSVDLSKGIVVCPLLSFYFYFSLFLLFCGLDGSFYLTLICPLWDLLILSFLGSFPHCRGNTLYITRSIGDLSHFTKVLTQIKCNYHDANVCLFQGSRICNDTSA